jgi:hypothetical protein
VPEGDVDRLSERGWEQARGLGRRLEDEGIGVLHFMLGLTMFRDDFGRASATPTPASRSSRAMSSGSSTASLARAGR